MALGCGSRAASRQLVSFADGCEDFVGGCISHDLLDGSQQVFADDGILFGLDTQRAVFLSDEFDGRGEGGEVVNMGEIGTDGTGEGFLLAARMLVGLVEKGFDFGVSCKHLLIEDPCDRFRIGGDNWCDFLDDGDGFVT